MGQASVIKRVSLLELHNSKLLEMLVLRRDGDRIDCLRLNQVHPMFMFWNVAHLLSCEFGRSDDVCLVILVTEKNVRTGKPGS